MPIKSLLFREKTNVPVKEVITFNAPGIYYPPYGKTSFLLQGQGTAGTAAVPSTVAAYYPATGGNYAGTNAPVAGNPATVNAYDYRSYYSTVYGQWNPGTYAPAGSWAYSSNLIQTSYPIPATYTYTANSPAGVTLVTYALGNTITYNPTTPGNAFYNPYYPAYSNYNAYVPATTGGSSNILGVTLPGGSGGAAPIVGYVPISTVSYTNVGVPISVPSGGYVKIQNI